jgi:hypothetical protein
VLPRGCDFFDLCTDRSSSGCLRDEKQRAFRAMRPLAATEVVHGQFRDYCKGRALRADSNVETFAAIGCTSTPAMHGRAVLHSDGQAHACHRHRNTGGVQGEEPAIRAHHCTVVAWTLHGHREAGASEIGNAPPGGTTYKPRR